MRTPHGNQGDNYGRRADGEGFSHKSEIIRKKGGTEELIEKVKMDEPVFGDDVVVVPESYFRYGREPA